MIDREPKICRDATCDAYHCSQCGCHILGPGSGPCTDCLLQEQEAEHERTERPINPTAELFKAMEMHGDRPELSR